MSYSRLSAFDEAAPSDYEKLTMPTTLEHIETLEKEEILDVSSKVDIRSNLKRVCKQVETRQNAINEINDYQKKNMKNLVNFEQCLNHSKFSHFAPMSGGSMIETPSINRVDFKICYKPFDTKSEWLKIEKETIEQKNNDLKVAEKRKDNINARVWSFERFNASSGFDFIHQATSEKVPGTVQPDMNEGIRMRDNFNTLSNQVIDMNQEIIDKKQYLHVGSLSLQPTIRNFLGERASGRNYKDSFPVDEILTKIQEAKLKIPKTSNTSI